MSNMMMAPILGSNRPRRKAPQQLDSIDFLADEALRTNSSVSEFPSGSSSARLADDNRAPTPPLGSNFHAVRPSSGEESRMDRPHTGDGIRGLPSLSTARNPKSLEDAKANGKAAWGKDPSPFAGDGEESSPSYHKKQQQKYTQMRALRARVKELENKVTDMQERCDAAQSLEKRAEKAEKRLSEMGYDDMKRERAQSKSRIMKLEKSLARAKREVADYTKLKQQETKELHDKNKLLTQAAAQEKTANRVMSAKLVEMEAALKSALHRLSISEANSIREVQEKERMSTLLQAQIRAREESDKARDSAQKAHSAAKFVQRAAQDELLMSRRKLASITEERNLANAKLARLQREQAEAAAKLKEEGYNQDEKSRLTAGGKKETPTGKQIYRGGRRLNDRYLLFQVLQSNSPFELHFVSYQPEEAQEDFVTWTVEDIKRVIANTNEFLEVENIEDPDAEIMGIVPKKTDQLLDILFDSIHAGFKQGELILSERPEAQEHMFMREKEEIAIFRGIYKVGQTQLVFTVNEEWFFDMNQPPTLRFLAFNPLNEKEYDLRLSPGEIEIIAPDYVGYRASEDMDNPLPSKAKVSRAKMGKNHDNGSGIAPPVRHMFLYTLMDHLELSMTRSFTGTGVEVVEERLAVRGQNDAVPYGVPASSANALQGATAEYGSVMHKTQKLGQREAAAAARLTREPKTIQRTAKLLDGDMYTLTVNEYWTVANEPSSLLFTVFDPESEESAEIMIARPQITDLVTKAQQQRTQDAPAEHLKDEESPAERKDILHFLESRLRLEFRDETDFLIDAGRMQIFFEQQKSEEDLALEREREAKQIEQILLATAESDKSREIYRFGWRLPHEGSRSETAEGGKHLMLRMLRLPEEGVEVRAVVAGGAAEGVECMLSQADLLDMGLRVPPAPGDRLADKLAGDEAAGLKDKHLQMWCRRLAVRLVLSSDETELKVRTPRPFVHEEVPIKCAVIEDEGLTRQEVMIVQVWRVEAEQDDMNKVAVVGELTADAVKLVLWSPAINGASDKEPKTGTSLTLTLSATELSRLGLVLPQSTKPENGEDVADRWAQQLQFSLELVPSANIARPEPHTFGSVRVVTMQRTDIVSKSRLPHEILYQKSRQFSGERWLVSVRAPTAGDEMLVSATPQTAGSTNLVLRLLVSGEKALEVGGPRALAECAQIRNGALHLPAPKLLHKGGLRLSNAYLIVSVFEEVAGPHEGGVRVEAYDFRTASMADLSLYKDELIALGLCEKKTGSALAYDSDMEEEPPVLDVKAIKLLLDLLLMVSVEGTKEKKLTLRSMKELRAKMEDVSRENAATTLQNQLRARKAKKEVGEKRTAAAKHKRETTLINLHRGGMKVEDVQLLLRVVGTIGEMQSDVPVVHVSAIEISSGVKHTMTVDGPTWADGQVAIKDFCKQLARNLEFVTTPEGLRVLRAKGSKDSAAALAAAEEWRADPFKTFVAMLKDNKVDKLIFALSNVPGAVEERFAENHKPLHFAAANGNLEFVKILVEHGADINAVTKENATPAMYAVPGAIASGDDGLGDDAREATLQYLLLHPQIDLTIAGTRGWCQGKTVQEIREAYGAANA